MQDAYVGDIGDYGKYGLLRNIRNTSLHIAINWYRVNLTSINKQKDGKYINYLSQPELYRKYDAKLFDELHRIVINEQNRKIEEVEAIDIGGSFFFSKAISQNRELWHRDGLSETQKADIVFLDPDNGLATKKMMGNKSYSEKHVLWNELKDYYDRGQSVILYQHRPQMTKRDIVIEQIVDFDKTYLKADMLLGLEFPKFTNRYYFFFCHNKHAGELKKSVDNMNINWQGFCKQITF